ncbi:hypothetical protein I4F81_007129 [Pyropia yezoensis]|uniref:Uncharacterized protein n=1 Tax=Pyropia yezoensis TaxID=2788 RepID=A0ACC3C379_PYRYE|nr:hypothetical protein I4F81_007129 [Neopyropia yezoensis]
MHITNTPSARETSRHHQHKEKETARTKTAARPHDPGGAPHEQQVGRTNLARRNDNQHTTSRATKQAPHPCTHAQIQHRYVQARNHKQHHQQQHHIQRDVVHIPSCLANPQAPHPCSIRCARSMDPNSTR